MKVKTADQSTRYADPQPGEDPEEQGLRILARFIARKLAKARRHEYARACELSEDGSSASVTTDENIS